MPIPGLTENGEEGYRAQTIGKLPRLRIHLNITFILAYARTYRNVSADALAVQSVVKIEERSEEMDFARIELHGIWYILRHGRCRIWWVRTSNLFPPGTIGGPIGNRGVEPEWVRFVRNGPEVWNEAI